MVCVGYTMVFVSLSPGLMFHDPAFNLQFQLNPPIFSYLPPSSGN